MVFWLVYFHPAPSALNYGQQTPHLSKYKFGKMYAIQRRVMEMYCSLATTSASRERSYGFRQYLFLFSIDEFRYIFYGILLFFFFLQMPEIFFFLITPLSRSENIVLKKYLSCLQKNVCFKCLSSIFFTKINCFFKSLTCS